MSTNTKPDAATIECPRCGEKNVNQPVCWNCKYNLQDHKVNRKSQMNWGIAVLVIIGLYIVIIIAVRQLSREVYQSTAASRMFEPVKQRLPDLQMREYGTTGDGKNFYVKGRITNNSKYTYMHIRVPIEIQRNGVLKSIEFGKVNDLAPGTSGEFKTLIRKIGNGDNIILQDISGSPSDK